ncbi:hypothetical protein L1D53_24610 [Vibrio alginolyticus]|uniref:hypothetical protein n=1 Tax=Vibrio alginolyticus TaxID=663 RepID=UPI001EFE86DE|nr:hypothetical protein [Vibrio alginolyticus]MCG9766674.1 hypothetical protein [Vibrio alginolyticus]
MSRKQRITFSLITYNLRHALHEFEMMIATLVSERGEVATELDEFKHRYYQDSF